MKALLIAAAPEDSVAEPVVALSELFADNWQHFATFAVSLAAIAIAVTLFKMAANGARRLATGDTSGGGIGTPADWAENGRRVEEGWAREDADRLEKESWLLEIDRDDRGGRLGFTPTGDYEWRCGSCGTRSRTNQCPRCD